MRKKAPVTEKTLYFVSVADDETGEVEGFFDHNGEHLHSWACNDGNWRGEYFDGLLSAIGDFEVRYDRETPKLLRAKMEAKLKKVFEPNY